MHICSHTLTYSYTFSSSHALKAHTSNRKMMSAAIPSTMAYIDNGLLSCRARGMYKNLLLNDIDTVRFLANDTLHAIRYSTVYDVETMTRACDYLYKILVNIAFKHYDRVSSDIRNIHYLIESQYTGDGCDIHVIDGVKLINRY